MTDADVAIIATSGLPVLCFDTCTALDLMRDPTREDVRVHERLAALDLFRAVKDNRRLILLMAEQVHREFGDNASNVEQEAKTAFKKLKLQMQKFDGVAAAYGAVGVTSLDHLNDHSSHARSVADRWIAGAALVRESIEMPKKALKRVVEARTPAKKGKDSTKDCIVIETYLDFVHRLRSAGLTTPIVFVSSNLKDYADFPLRVLKGDLASEFKALSLEFAPNLSAAKHSLGL